MKNVTIHEAKTNFSRLIQNVEAGEDVLISRGPRPVARLVAVGKVNGERKPGLLKGFLTVGPEFFEPLPADELTGWE